MHAHVRIVDPRTRTPKGQLPSITLDVLPVRGDVWVVGDQRFRVLGVADDAGAATIDVVADPLVRLTTAVSTVRDLAERWLPEQQPQVRGPVLDALRRAHVLLSGATAPPEAAEAPLTPILAELLDTLGEQLIAAALRVDVASVDDALRSSEPQRSRDELAALVAHLHGAWGEHEIRVWFGAPNDDLTGASPAARWLDTPAAVTAAAEPFYAAGRR